MLAASQHGYMINATDCMYSKLPAEDEWFICSKHVEDIYWNKFKKKVHLVGSYYAKHFIYHVSMHLHHLQEYHPSTLLKLQKSLRLQTQ